MPDEDDFERSLLYRLLMKIPRPFKLPATFSSIFWTMIFPSFLACEFFIGIFVFVFFIFPFNVLIAGGAMGIVFLTFLRIQVDRDVNIWKALTQGSREWNIEKTLKELDCLTNGKRVESDNDDS